MTSYDEVKAFLNQFSIKLNIYGIIFRDDRQKNVEALAILDITKLDRLNVVRSIEVKDYVQGPIIDELNMGSEMWVFGRDVNSREVYIKITLGGENRQTICISFHVAEHPLTYPFKNK